ncbi:Two-component response regulator SSK1p [Oleoguttula sp. CCFEE 5521]
MPRFSILQRPFLRRNSSKLSAASDDSAQIVSSSSSSDLASSRSLSSFPRRPQTSSNATLKDRYTAQGANIPDAVAEQRESVLVFDEDVKGGAVVSAQLRTPSDPPPRRSGSETLGESTPELVAVEKAVTPPEGGRKEAEIAGKEAPALVIQAPTPAGDEALPDIGEKSPLLGSTVTATSEGLLEITQDSEEDLTGKQEPRRSSSAVSPRHLSLDSGKSRERASSAAPADTPIGTTVLDTSGRDAFAELTSALPTVTALDYFTPGLPNVSNMLNRKIWVRRPGASATLVQIKEDDLVDDVREMILKKYANSLGKTFDAPDMLLWVSARSEPGQQRSERILGPEEEMGRTIDRYFPGGQTVEDALTIDVPPKRTPRASPRAYNQQSYQQGGYAHAMDEYRPMESGNDYFPPMPASINPTLPQPNGSHDGRGSHQHPSISEHQRSISVLSTGHLPPLPSPGGTRRLLREHRPKFNRQHTSSPTIVQHQSGVGTSAAPQSVGTLGPQMHVVHRGSVRPRNDSNSSEVQHLPNGVSLVAPLPTPSAPDTATSTKSSAPPTPSGSAVAAHSSRTGRLKKNRKPTPEKPGLRSRRDRNASTDSPKPGLISNMLDASIPPINVLIVEDNIINLRILEGLMKRLKVRWETAMNGQIAVDKWRGGGYHLVLMDIQMPIMNGIQATKEIRRLEKVNGIGVFSSSTPTSPAEHLNITSPPNGNPTANEAALAEVPKANGKPNDHLPLNEGFFKSPVIIVALTASSLQSDRHEALAAGCNDFLTKPVNYTWLERKVKEWGCMQALIDFDGWRKWKDYDAKEEAGKSEEEKRKEAEIEEKQKRKMEKLAILQERQKAKREAEEEAKKRGRMGSGSKAERREGLEVPVPEQVDGVSAPVFEEGFVGLVAERKKTPVIEEEEEEEGSGN